MPIEDIPLHHFTAGTYIELDDPLTGKSFIARVCESGTEFIDATENMPLPIFAALHPVEIGDFRTLKNNVMENRPEEYAIFSDFITGLFDAMPQFDDLIFMRAVKWAFDGGNYKTAGGARRALEHALVLEQQARSRHTSLTGQTQEDVNG
ncbi:MAG: hypothetical protein LBI87_00960 [Candidatus Accumulibacter sp.]|jgi:hypothetical protein|nr:hypothetical protein [Accumulibacter sp.]